MASHVSGYLDTFYILFFFFFNDTATTEIYTLSLHDALPISRPGRPSFCRLGCCTAMYATGRPAQRDRKSTRLNSSHVEISYAVFCLQKKKKQANHTKLPKQKKEKNK